MRWPLGIVGIVLLYLAWTTTAIRLQYDSAVVHGESLRQRFFAADTSTTIDFQLAIPKGDKGDRYLEIFVMHGDAILSFPGKTHLHPGVISFCCSQEYSQGGLCPIVGSLVVPKQQEIVSRYQIPFGAEFNLHLRLNTTGPHALLISNCGQDAVTISGFAYIVSARGRLPLHLYNLSTFYWFTAGLITVVLAVIIIALVPFRNEIHLGHGVIGAALIAVIVEFSLWIKSMALYNETDDRKSFLEVFAIICSIVRRSAVFVSMAVVLFGYGLNSRFHFSDLTPIDRKQLTVFTLLYVIIQMLGWVYFSEGSFVQVYELSPFFVPLIIDLVALAFLVRPALRTKALLSATRPRTAVAAAFDRLLAVMTSVLIVFILNCGMSINFAENRGYIRHHRVAFLFPEAIVQMTHSLMAAALMIFTPPLGAYAVNLTRIRWRYPHWARGTDSRSPDELSPLQ